MIEIEQEQEQELTEVPHQDDMTVRIFYRHMGARHPMQGMDFDKLQGLTIDNGAYRAFLSYHARMHDQDDDFQDSGAYDSQFDHYHAESELTDEQE